ncbi:PLP-dependent aminotransferase family protein [uncultured Kiloniella sp.]|uniref:MocR-like pyridoxine biosynthesis transcription factor PdxR n=1 Tax=uncultured Kiloniella sp. TaxID=1133091 RepID=UPI00262CC0A8|nr:PLP-dependent aminotransferase family protein [uncultured Kiloniella sp.]
MVGKPTNTPLLDVVLDKTSNESLQHQLFSQLREMVLNGRLQPGERLPSTRSLAKELACSRNTVLGAFDQLLAEGYLEGLSGSGTYISNELPDDIGLASAKSSSYRQAASDANQRGLSKRGEQLAIMQKEKRAHKNHPAFSPGMTDVESFPFPLWARSLSRTWRYPKDDLLRNPDPCGYIPLRKEIADYLRVARGIKCDWQQIMITSGARQATDFMARILLDSGDTAWFEEPGYPGLKGPLHSAGIEMAFVPVDDEGLSVQAGRSMAENARMAVVSPSHQYPLGVVMSLRRRLELLDWAEENDAWILEDDYESEFRFSGKPISSLQGLEAERRGHTQGASRVVYLGSFSKVLFHVLRLGYLVVPEHLVDAVRFARMLMDERSSLLAQPALADFMAEGHFSSHIRRMRKVYAQRQKMLVQGIEKYLSDYLEINPNIAGLHITAYFTDTVSEKTTDREIVAEADKMNLSASPLSLFYNNKTTARQGLLLGYGACHQNQIESGCKRLAAVFKKMTD